MCRTSVFTTGENLDEGGIHFRRAMESPKGGAALWAAKPKKKGTLSSVPFFLDHCNTIDTRVYPQFKDKTQIINFVLPVFAQYASQQFLVFPFHIAEHSRHEHLIQAYESRKPAGQLLFHTDRGSNYRSYAMCSYLKELGVIQSFSKSGVPYDNSVMESFFSSLKREELYRTKYRSEVEFRAAVDAYMVFYNERRPHAKNGYKTPMKLESIYFEGPNGPETCSE